MQGAGTGDVKMGACQDRAVAEFAYKSLEGMSSVLAKAATVLGLGAKLPFPQAQAAAKVGAVTGVASGAAAFAASKYRDQYDSLEAQCPKQPDTSHNPTQPAPSGAAGTGGGGYGNGSTSLGHVPQAYYSWQAGSAYLDSAGDWRVTAGKWIVQWRPLVIDLDNNGFDLVPSTESLKVDFNGDGVYTSSSWVGPRDGLIIYDANQNNIAETAEWALTSFVPGAQSDMEALRAFDTNYDGNFDGLDAEFSMFKIGIDANQDGKFTEGEVHSFSEFGIDQIYMGQYQNQNLNLKNYVAGVDVDSFGSAFSYSSMTAFRLASVSFTEESAPVTVHEDGQSKIVDSSAGRSLFWMGGDLNVDLSSYQYAQYDKIDHVVGGSGNDIIRGNENNNTLYGSSGIDSLYGGAGNDVLIVDEQDLVYGTVDGGADFDVLVLEDTVQFTMFASNYQVEGIVGASGSDFLYAGTTQNVTLDGGAGNDTIVGSAGSDALTGGSGDDVLSGGDGNDTYYLERQSGHDTIFDTSGFDTIVIKDGGVDNVTVSGNNLILHLRWGSDVLIVDGAVVGQGVEEVKEDVYTWSQADLLFFASFNNNSVSPLGSNEPFMSAINDNDPALQMDQSFIIA